MKFTFQTPTRLIFGSGRLDALGDEKLPGKKALLLTSRGKSAERTGALERTMKALERAGAEYVYCPMVESNPVVDNVMKAALAAREAECDFVIALGGGSVMDCGKAVAMMATNPGDFWDYVPQGTGGRKPIEIAPLPIVAISTTAGTGSEVDGGGVISNPETKEKIGFGGHPGLYPVLAVVDPELTLSVPPKLTAYQGFDALFHAVEGYLTKRPNYMSDMFALEAVRHIASGLARAVKDGHDLEAREHVSIANTLGGYVMACCRLTSQHALEHALSGECPEMQHGAGLIMLSIAYFSHMIKTGANSMRFIELAHALGVKDAVHPDDFLRALHDLQIACGVADLKMSDYGITRDDIPKLAAKARSVGAALFEQDAVALTFEDTVSILDSAWR
ncbi:iron-containing alcohol dehydrogenase [Sutterella wadsworthensis]|uniref:iron-containing alcohol dehydrogenase n=1 Tax=Sutterella wadsworthensis TaxID=40545 RepID=UPI00243012C3|nr:iron-containing alcohol dehydrogenase [Sutterella wadsworthensis]